MTAPKIEALFPLTPVQEGMLIESLAAGEAGVHLEQMLWNLHGRLDVPLLAEALRWVVQLHPVLRTGFVWKDQEEPLQVVLASAPPVLEIENWCGLPPAVRAERLDTCLQADRRRGFRLSRPPLLRVRVMAVEAESWQILWTHHHLLLDGWCLHLLFSQLFDVYEALCRGAVPQAAPSLSYERYVRWLGRQDLQVAAAFWRKSLAGFPGPTPLGVPTPAARVETERHGRLDVSLPPAETAALLALARRSRLTLNVLVQGGWALLLQAVSGWRDVVFGVTCTHRPAELDQNDAMLGVFINTLPLRVRIEPALAVGEWLASLQNENLELQQYAYCGAGQVHSWSGLPASVPLYESLVVVENYPVRLRDPAASGLHVELPQVHYQGARTRHALTLLVTLGPELRLQLVYDGRRFEGADGEIFLAHLLSLLAAMPSKMEGPLSELLAVLPEERPGFRALPAPAGLAAGDGLPRTPIEELMAEIWAQLLGIERIGIHDDFFAFGGHSLLATRLVARVSNAFEVDLPLQCLFAYPTAAGLAAEVRRRKSGNSGEPMLLTDLPPLRPDPERRYQPFPLTEVQQAYWIGRRGDFELGNVATHCYLEVEVRGVEIERLNVAWQRLIDRHDMLRALVLTDGRQQILQRVPPYRIELQDLRGQDAATQAYMLEAVRSRLGPQVLPADRWPLFEICASQLADGRLLLHLSYDMLICDARSAQILSRELAVMCADPAAALPSLTLSFRDYVLAELALRDSAMYQRSLEYWRSRIGSLPPPPELTLAKSPESLVKPRFCRRSGRLARTDWDGLKGRAAQAGLTPSGLLLAAFAEVLTAWSRSPRYTINVTLFNRLPLHAQVDQIVGDFTTLTLLAIDHTLPAPFAARARLLQEQLWERLENRYVSGVRVLRELNRQHPGGRRVLMPVVFTSTLPLGRREGEGDPELGELVFMLGQTPQVWLDCQVAEAGGALSFWWDAVDALFPEGMLDGMFGAYSDLLCRLAAAEEPLQEPVRGLLPMEQLELHGALNAVGPLPPPRLLHDAFLVQSAVAPERAAVITTSHVVTYGELERGSLRLAYRLRRLGGCPNTLVAVVMEKGWEQVAAVLGVLRSGAAYLPIDPATPTERLHYLLHHGEVVVALTQPWLADTLEWPPEILVMPVVPELLAAGEAGPPLAAVQGPDDLAYVIYTSGSTGLPKGVMIDHRGAWNTVEDVNARFELGPQDRVLGLSSLSFDLSVYDIFGTLAAGAALVLPASVRDPDCWLELARRERVSVWNSVPTLLEILFESSAGRPPLPALRLILLSGDWIPLALAGRARELYPDACLVSLGGATEASIWSIAFQITEIDPAWTSIPYGKPLTHQSFHVLDEQLNPRPVWTTGHLYIGGVGLARGYWRDEERTMDAFIFDPHTGQRLYRAGDLGRLLPNGNIEFQGRQDLQVKVHGHRIELAEIEAALASHPGVEATVVAPVGVAGSRHLVGYVVPNRRSPAGLLAKEEGAAAIDPAAWAAMLTAGQECARRLPAIGVDAAAVEAFRERLRRMVAAYCAGALLRLGCFALAGERRSVDELIDVYGVEPRFRRWLVRCLELLAELSLLVREGEVFVSRRPLAVEPPAPILAELRRDVEAGFRDANTRAAALAGLALYERLGERLAELLSGVLQHVQVMFPDGSPELADDIYRLSFRRAYEVAQAVVAAWVAAHPASRPLRVLEIGAGVGSITDWLLAVLPAGRTVYAYTDISPYFTQLGAERFAGHPGLRCDLLDIEQDPLGQGFEPAAWDLVVAADVLHATALIAESVRHVRSLLAPGGVLLLVEHTRFEAPFNLAMGLAQGFDRFADDDLRTLHPLLSTELWWTVLASCGFAELAVIDEEAMDAELTGVHLMLARAEAARMTFQPEALRSFLRAKLPEYMVPSQFMTLAALPLSANGKIARDRLPLPEPAAAPRDSAQAVLRTPVEELVAVIWQQVLGCADVTPGDNFFELGGDSLLATRLASRLGRVFGVELPLRLVFEAPMLAEFARRLTALLESGAGVTAPPILKLPYVDRGPLAFAQRRLWFLDRLHPGSSSFNIPGALRAQGRLVVAALARAVDELVRRHEPLRTRFESHGGSPVQVVDSPFAVPVPVIDLRSLPAAVAEEEARQLVRFAAEQPFDLTRVPLVRLRLLRLRDDDHILLFNLHHIIADAWSLGIVVRETAALYRAFLHGQPSPLGDPPLRYMDFAFWQQQWLQGEVLERHLAYWRRQLAHLSPLQLPADRPRPAVYRFRGAVQEAGLEAALVEGLQRWSRGEGATLFMVLLAAFKVVLHAWTGQDDLAVATSIANRNREEIEGSIGTFVNLLVLRTDLSGNPTFRQLVERLRETTVAAYVHQDLPFEKLVEDFQPARNLTEAMPLVQVLFVLENAPLSPLRLPGLTLSPFGPRHEVARYDLNFHVVPDEEKLALVLHYNRDLFEPATAVALLEGYLGLLPRVLAQPDVPVAELAGRIAGQRRRQAAEALRLQREMNQQRLLRPNRWIASADQKEWSGILPGGPKEDP